MPDTNEQDAVKEARGLLANAAHGPLTLVRYEHGGGRLIKEPFSLIADFYDVGNRELYYRAPELIKTLCDEVDRLRTQNQTQAESITYFQENEKKLRAQLKDGQRGLVIMSALINFVDWLDAEGVVTTTERGRGELVKRFLDAHQEGENYFMQAEQIANILGVPFSEEGNL